MIVCSTGIGGPSTSIAVEELAQLGIRTFLRIGTTGAIQPHINVGDVLVTTASVRLDGQACTLHRWNSRQWLISNAPPRWLKPRNPWAPPPTWA